MSALDNWREEKQSAWLYRQVAAVEDNPVHRRLFESLATAAESQARIWEAEAKKAGLAPSAFKPSLRARIIAWLLHRLGPAALQGVLAAMKVRGMSVYGHRAAPPGHPMPTTVASVGQEVGERHRSVSAGGNLRAAVFGVNDGLVSNTSLIMGVAGATADVGFVLTSGVAGLLAGALSMAAGEYVSMRSQREMYEYQIGLEREELEQYPREEAEELALIYEARGVPLTEARRFASTLMKDKAHALETLAREELGLNPDDLGSAWGAAISSFLSFAIGAVIPLLPFLFGATLPVTWAAGAAALSLFAVGAVISLFTGRSAFASGLRMVLIGGGAGVITYSIGLLLGVSLG